MKNIEKFGCINDIVECGHHEFVDGVHYCSYYGCNISELTYCGVGDDK